jgi:hypothetical protein
MLRVADHSARTDTGRQRPANEDSYWVGNPLFVLADGMGGAQAGEVASQTAVEVFAGGLPDGPGSHEERLAGLVGRANARIHELAQADDAHAGMGTTLTAAYVGEDDLAIAHVATAGCSSSPTTTRWSASWCAAGRSAPRRPRTTRSARSSRAPSGSRTRSSSTTSPGRSATATSS